MMSEQTAPALPGFSSGVPLVPTALPGAGRSCQRLLVYGCYSLALGEPHLDEYGLHWEESCHLLSFIHCLLVISFYSPVGPQFLPLLTNQQEALGTG